MGRKSKFSSEEKLRYVLRCIQGKNSISHTATSVGIYPSTLRQRIHNYESLGIDTLSSTSKNSSNSTALKEMAVKDYFADTRSLLDICKKYGLRSKRMPCEWGMKYNSHEELKASGTRGMLIMTNGRKTTYDERVEIINYCIEH